MVDDNPFSLSTLRGFFPFLSLSIEKGWTGRQPFFRIAYGDSDGQVVINQRPDLAEFPKLGKRFAPWQVEAGFPGRAGLDGLD